MDSFHCLDGSDSAIARTINVLAQPPFVVSDQELQMIEQIKSVCLPKPEVAATLASSTFDLDSSSDR